MAIPISIDKLLTEHVVEWSRIEFKTGGESRNNIKNNQLFCE